MKDSPSPQGINSVAAIVAGILSAAAMGAILYPAAIAVFNRYFHLFEPSATKDEIIVFTSFCLWLFIPCFAGGIACASIARKMIFAHIITCIILMFLILWLVTGSLPTEKIEIVVSTMIPLGFFLAGWLVFARKRKKASRQQFELLQQLPMQEPA